MGRILSLSPGQIGFLPTSMASLCDLWMLSLPLISSSRKRRKEERVLDPRLGQIGFERISLPTLTRGFDLTSFPLLLTSSASQRTLPKALHPVVTVHAFPRVPSHDAAMLNKITAGGLDGWAWNEIKADSPWFFDRLSPSGVGYRDFLMHVSL